MCGFTGYYGFGNYDRKQILDAMGECIAHRGPDSDGTFLDDHVALGFRRLSIIDLEGGSQPILFPPSRSGASGPGPARHGRGRHHQKGPHLEQPAHHRHLRPERGQRQGGRAGRRRR